MNVQMPTSDDGVSELKRAAADLHTAVELFRDAKSVWKSPDPITTLTAQAESWNFTTFEKFMNQRFVDLSLQLRERYEAQQTGLAAALAAAEKAVNAALIAAEKAVDKAEGAQQLRNEAQNEFRKSLSDLSALMWTIKEGSAAVEALRREYTTSHGTLVDRVTSMENGAANIQGRIWAVSAMWAVLALAASVTVRFIVH